MVRLESKARQRQPITIHTPRGIGHIVTDPDTKEVLHRLELRKDERHGGQSGTMCWYILNYVDSVEVSFCLLHYEALYDGLSSTPSHEGVNSILLDTHFRELKDSSESTDTWKHFVLQVVSLIVIP